MYELAAVLLTLLAAAGIALLISAFRDRPAAAPRKVRRQLKVSRRTRVLGSIGLLAGVAVWLFTGWLLAVVLAPALLIGLPALLAAPTTATAIDRLVAMEEWTRNLANVLGAGKSLEQAIIATARSIPAALSTEIGDLIARLRANRSTEGAIRSFNETLNDATGDLICSALLMGSRMRDGGLKDVLDGVTETVAEDVRNRRAVEADRSKPRTTARLITIVATIFLAGAFVSGYFDPYKSPFGQLVLTVLIAAYVGVLVWIKRIQKAPPLPRFLGSTVRVATNSQQRPENAVLDQEPARRGADG